MPLLNSEQAKALLIQEYPILKNSNLQIVKQFVSEKGRGYNTFLIESNLEGFLKFVAKGIVFDTQSLELEWKTLTILSQRHANAPLLLIPDHVPQNFLLLEYIDGINLSELVKDKTQINKAFELAGIATGKLHSIQLERFGSLLSSQCANWDNYLTTKTNERLLGVKELVSEQLYKKCGSLFDALKDIVYSESLGEPILIHRDIYFDNFILKQNSNDAILIDYGMTMSGRPFYDFGKFYILELYKYPEYKNVFINAYANYSIIPSNFNELLKVYILTEALGMIGFYSRIGEIKGLEHAILVLDELTSNKGIIFELIS